MELSADLVDRGFELLTSPVADSISDVSCDVVDEELEISNFEVDDDVVVWPSGDRTVVLCPSFAGAEVSLEMVTALSIEVYAFAIALMLLADVFWLLIATPVDSFPAPLSVIIT